MNDKQTTIERVERSRMFLLIDSTILVLLIGISYAWSVFMIPLSDRFGWTMSSLSFGYTIFCLVVVIANLVFIPVIRKHTGVRNSVILGGICYGAGIALCCLSGNIVLYVFLLSGMAGIGTGLIFPILLTYSQRLFPERTGFASGIVCLGYGFGAVAMAPIINGLFNLTGDIVRTFVIFGLVSMVLVVGMALFLREVPDGFEDYILDKAGRSRVPAGSGGPGLRGELDRKGIVKDPVFYAVYLSLAICSICGIMVISQGSPIIQNVFGKSADTAALYVSVIAIFNTLGRPIIGSLSDRTGKGRAMLLVNVLVLCAMAALCFAGPGMIYIAGMLMAAFCYGAMACLISPLTSELWGAAHGAENYGVTFSIFGVSALAGPPTISRVFETTGSYTGAFLFGLVLAVIGAALMGIVVRSVYGSKAR